eukprot:TRINITY_DN1714_c0_g1_i3.p1 TRINITY_DN1714_c0_g1~~TRINITY_DN1714_c0_g1_i3.p1  ORF type:complete len:171 (-),score=13.74 TRINITY_DN1714_c0_g1_i3:431-943(-)
MASAFARSARHSFRAGANAFRQSASSSSSSARSAAHCPSRCRFLMQNSVPRRRILQSAIPLHNAVAAAKLVSHLSTSSRSSIDPLSYMHPILACNFLKTSMSKLHRCWTTSKSLLLTLSRNIFSKSNKVSCFQCSDIYFSIPQSTQCWLCLLMYDEWICSALPATGNQSS